MSLDTVARDDAYLARKAAPRIPIAIGIVGQSTERGQVDPIEAIGGVASATAFPQAYRSLRNPGLFYPIGPAVTKVGCNWFKLYDDLYDWGYDARIINGAIGSASFGSDIVGAILDRTNASSTNSKAVRAKRAPIGPGDRGFQGDYAVIGGKLFVATTAMSAFAMNMGFPLTNDVSNVPELDYTRVLGTGTTGASAPDASASTVGSTLADGTVTWTCLSVTTSYLGFTYTAGGALTESRAGFDPYGILRRVHEQMQLIRDAQVKIIILENGQSDASLSSGSYSTYLQQAASYFLNRGYIVMIGLTFYWPAGATTTQYNNLTSGVNSAVAALQGTFGTSRVVAGANLYSLLGTTGNMGGATTVGYVTVTTGVFTVNSVSFGALEVGQQLGSGIGIPGGITISSQLSGTTGGAGAYQTNATAAFGSSGSPITIIAAGAYFAKDYNAAQSQNQDALHPNARGAVAGGSAWANTIKTVLPQAPHP